MMPEPDTPPGALNVAKKAAVNVGDLTDEDVVALLQKLNRRYELIGIEMEATAPDDFAVRNRGIEILAEGASRAETPMPATEEATPPKKAKKKAAQVPPSPNPKRIDKAVALIRGTEEFYRAVHDMADFYGMSVTGLYDHALRFFYRNNTSDKYPGPLPARPGLQQDAGHCGEGRD